MYCARGHTHHEPDLDASLSHDDHRPPLHRVVTAGYDGVVRVWDISSVLSDMDMQQSPSRTRSLTQLASPQSAFQVCYSHYFWHAS
jgi:hypothetical protein